MLFSVFSALGPKSIPTPPTVAFTEFFHADTGASVHLLPVSWYLISSVCVYLCSCLHIMSILCFVKATIRSVGMLIGSRARKSLNSIEKIQPRMMVASFNDNPSATIISCYSPNKVSEETEFTTFYNELSSLVHSIPKHNVLVIGGNMNAQIEKNRNHKFTQHNLSNRNGQYLTDFMLENRLTCRNTNFQKREGTLWT